MSKLDELIFEINGTTFQGEHGLVHTPTYEVLKQRTKDFMLELAEAPTLDQASYERFKKKVADL